MLTLTVVVFALVSTKIAFHFYTLGLCISFCHMFSQVCSALPVSPAPVYQIELDKTPLTVLTLPQAIENDDYAGTFMLLGWPFEAHKAQHVSHHDSGGVGAKAGQISPVVPVAGVDSTAKRGRKPQHVCLPDCQCPRARRIDATTKKPVS